METDLPQLLVLACIAALSPLLLRIPIKARLPLVVIELVLGMMVGPHGLGWVTVDATIGFLSTLGLAFLFFLAGIELDIRAIAGRPLKLATASWITSFVVAVGVCYALSLSGVLDAPVLVAIAVSTTALGILIPILRDSGILRTPFGTLVLAAASASEFGPILMLSLVASQHASVTTHVLLMVGFVVLSVIALVLAARARPSRVETVMSSALQMNSQFAVRLSVLLLIALVVLAGDFGLDVILGAFTAGMFIGILTRGQKGAELRDRIETLGFGFFIPLFFVSSGVKYDFTALFASTEALIRLPIYLALMLGIRLLVVLPWYRKDLTTKERMPFALLVSTGLPLIVAIAEIGVHGGHMRSENAAALVGAAMLSVLLFPILAAALSKPAAKTSSSVAHQQ